MPWLRAMMKRSREKEEKHEHTNGAENILLKGCTNCTIIEIRLTYAFIPKWVDKKNINPLTVLPESHTGRDHALRDLFRVNFTANESDNP